MTERGSLCPLVEYFLKRLGFFFCCHVLLRWLSSTQIRLAYFYLLTTRMGADLSSLSCQTASCPAYRAAGLGNLSVCGWIGKHRNIRQLYCNVCRSRFSEHKGTVRFRSHLSPDVMDIVIEGIEAGERVSQAATEAGVDTSTFARYRKLVQQKQ